MPITLPAHNTWPYSYTGHPTITLPCGKSEGLPVGLQFVGRKFAEDKLLQTAYAFESSVDWDGLIAVGGQPVR